MVLTILLVDDDPFALKVLERQLTGPTTMVLCARHAGEALHYLGTRHVDVLITDQVMPAMSGDALVREAKHIQPNLTPILMSANVEEARVAMRDERTPVFEKDFALTELAPLILGPTTSARAA